MVWDTSLDMSWQVGDQKAVRPFGQPAELLASASEAVRPSSTRYNMHWLLKMTAKKGIGPFWRVSGGQLGWSAFY